MRSIPKCVALAVVLASLALATAACGGGGSGGLSDSSFAGTYLLASLSKLRSAAMPAGEAAEANWGQVAADGAGTLAQTFGRNDDGTVSGPMAGSPIGYSVAADGSVTFPGSIGGLTSDGGALVFMQSTPGSKPTIGLALRSSGTTDKTTFSGSYHFGEVLGLVGVYQSVYSTTAQGPVLADGTGGVTYPAMNVNNAGSAAGATAPGSTSFDVAADGTFTSAVPGGTVQGGIAADGSFAFCAGGKLAMESPLLAAYVKVTSGATNALFHGTYWVVGLSSDPTASNAWTSFLGTVIADGAGGLVYLATTTNHEGTLGASSGPDDYAVQSDGTLLATDVAGASGGPFRTGAVSADGTYAFLCGGLNFTGPQLLLFVRK